MPSVQLECLLLEKLFWIGLHYWSTSQCKKTHTNQKKTTLQKSPPVIYQLQIEKQSFLDLMKQGRCLSGKDYLNSSDTTNKYKLMVSDRWQAVARWVSIISKTGKSAPRHLESRVTKAVSSVKCSSPFLAGLHVEIPRMMFSGVHLRIT